MAFFHSDTDDEVDGVAELLLGYGRASGEVRERLREILREVLRLVSNLSLSRSAL